MEAYHDQSGHIMVPSTASVSPRRAVVVLGMHRSGTSVVAGCLQRLGVDFGPRLMPPNPDNPRGYFEHNDLVNVHDRLLLALDRSWDDPAPFPPGWAADERLTPYRALVLTILRRDFASAPWGLKDPRLCRLLPWWEPLWAEVGCRPLFVLVRRAPAEIAASLARREGMSAAKALLLYLRHALEAERATRAHERVIVDFADFLRDERAALTPVRHALGVAATAEAAGPNVVDPTLGRASIPVEAAGFSTWTEEVDAALCAAKTGQESRLCATFDRVAAELQAAAPFLLRDPAEATADLQQQLLASRKQARWYEEEWRKAQAKSTRLQSRLDQVSAGGRNPPCQDLSELNVNSIVRKNCTSNMRNLAQKPPSPDSKFRRVWRLLRGR